MSNHIEITPQPGGQQRFLSKIFIDEVLYGGAAGPGKSWALVFDALGTQYLYTELGKPAYECSDYRAALFRRKTTQFSKLIDEGKKLYTPLGATLTYKRTGDPGPSFNFPSGARIFICHMEREENKEDHQGIEYQYVGFDELTQFTVTQYMYLFSRLRSTIPNLNSRMRATTNPTGSGLIWVKKRFIQNGTQKYKPNEKHYFEPDGEEKIEVNPSGKLVNKKTKYSKSRMFIPGLLYENQILMNADPYYELNIKAMGKQYEEALLKGNWDAFIGDFFSDFSKDLAVEPFIIPETWYIIGSIDPGWSSPCSFGLHAISPEGQIIKLFTYYEREKSGAEHAADIKKRIEEFPFISKRPGIIVAGHDAFAKKEKFSVYSHEMTWSDFFSKEGLFLTPAKTDRVLGWWTLKQIMRQGKWKYFKGYNDSLVEEIIAAQGDEKNPEDIKGRGNDPEVSDHALDETRYGIMAAFKGYVPKKPEPVRVPDLIDFENNEASY